MSAQPITREALLRGYPPAESVSAAQVRAARAASARRLIVLDDDPTGTQSVADLPVLTNWSEADLRWALQTGAPAVYVLTNSRSLDAETAAARVREVSQNALRAARELGMEVDFVSRSDSTLRGHYPLETDVLAAVLEADGSTVDGVLVVPAFGEAGRVTVDSVHYAGSVEQGYVPVGETDFARDATFGYIASHLPSWVEEKSGGRIRADDVMAITLEVVRSGPAAVAQVLSEVTGGRPVVVDIVEEADLRVLALAITATEAAGKRFLHRVGPPFVRALIGQAVPEPLSSADVAGIRAAGAGHRAAHGLIVVGSHVQTTSRQLEQLVAQRGPVELELDVTRVLGDDRDRHLEDLVEQANTALGSSSVVLRTSRTLVAGADPDASLDIARQVSDAVVQVVRGITAVHVPRFVVAKGGITSSDVASRGLSISRAIVRGPMLPGLVSLWEPVEGSAKGIPYIVFAGNVGTAQSLVDVVDKLTE